jgi:hypothetical protein
LLQCRWSLVGTSRQFATAQYSGRFWGEADMNRI